MSEGVSYESGLRLSWFKEKMAPRKVIEEIDAILRDEGLCSIQKLDRIEALVLSREPRPA